MTPSEVRPGPLCVDTDVFSLIFSKKGPYESFLPFLPGHTLVVSFAVVAELRAGALNRTWGEARRQRQERVLREYYVTLTPTDAVVHRYARIQAALGLDRLKGGGVNDMWTAACALSQSDPLPIITNNLSDFERIAAVEPHLDIVHPGR